MTKTKQLVFTLIAVITIPTALCIMLLAIPPVRKQVFLSQAHIIEQAKIVCQSFNDNKNAESLALSEAAVFEYLRKEEPDNVSYRNKMILLYEEAAQACASDKSGVRRRDRYFDLARELIESGLAKNPDDENLLVQSAVLHVRIAMANEQTRPEPHELIEKNYSEAERIFENLLKSKNGAVSQETHEERAVCLQWFANYLYGKDGKRAIALYESVLDSARKVEYKDNNLLHAQSWAEANLGWLQLQSKQTSEAKKNLLAGLQTCEKYRLVATPLDTNVCKLNTMVGLADAYFALNELPEAQRTYEQAIETADSIPPYYVDNYCEHQCCHAYIGLSKVEAKLDEPNAIESARQAVKHGRKSKSSWQTGDYHKLTLPSALANLAYLEVNEKNFTSAIAHLDEAIKILNECTAEDIADADTQLKYCVELRASSAKQSLEKASRS